MNEFVIGALAVSVLNLILLLFLLRKSSGSFDSSSLDRLEQRLKDELARAREESNTNAKNLREEVTKLFFNFEQMLQNNFKDFAERLEGISANIDRRMAAFQEDHLTISKETRSELAQSQKNMLDSLIKQLSEAASSQKTELTKFSEQIDKMTKSNETRMETLLEKVGTQLSQLQQSNEKKLEEMRATVDEKLHSTLEKRLGESFKLVSDRLENVQKGLGEMRELANGVGDLKRVLSNIKTRGTWGEIQLESLIDQMLTPAQYEKNAAVKPGSGARVEIAVKLPSREDSSKFTYIPIDAKFPLEAYQILMEAQDTVDSPAIDQAKKELERQIKLQAKTIAEKYIDPPNTTDFAIMFLPVEGLFAEVLRIPGLADTVQREMRVTITGPTTLAALLNSLQMGFRTLAIEKRSSEVWQLLGSVKTEFGKFGDLLEKTHKKIKEAGNSLENASRKSRTIERRLRDVEELPASGKQDLLGFEDSGSNGTEDE